jgi:hypothetical protein
MIFGLQCLLEPGAFIACISGVEGNIVDPLGRVIDTSSGENRTLEVNAADCAGSGTKATEVEGTGIKTTRLSRLRRE